MFPECIGEGIYRGICDECQSKLILDDEDLKPTVCETCGTKYKIHSPWVEKL